MQKIIQKNNQAEGDIVAGDKYVFQNENGTNEYIESLNKKLSQELLDEDTTSEYLDLLEDYTATTDDEIIGLKKKLELGGMAYLNRYASSSKERFVKNLVQNSMYQSAQRIYVHLLDKVCSSFESEISPRLENIPDDQKFKIVKNSVLNPTQRSLGKIRCT